MRTSKKLLLGSSDTMGVCSYSQPARKREEIVKEIIYVASVTNSFFQLDLRIDLTKAKVLYKNGAV